jgi:(+)-trans-carveol dehydrogenase
MRRVDFTVAGMASCDRVAGKIAFVTGAARGIGRACALRLASEGADLAVLDIGGSVEGVPYEGSTPEELDEIGAMLRSKGSRVLIFRADVRDEASLADAVASTERDLGPIEIVVAAAGIDSWGVAWELSEEQWQTMLDVNLTGVWHTAKTTVVHMLARERGSLVFIGSVLGHRPNNAFAHYAVAKHGVRGLTRALALELAPKSIRVNSVDPTSVATAMIMNQSYTEQAGTHQGATREEVITQYLEWNALPIPWIEPVDVANAVLFLASDEARYITGVSLPVDAGALLK